MTVLISAPKPSRTVARLPVTCGSCTFHTSQRLRVGDHSATCASLGVVAGRAPCDNYTPHAFDAGIVKAASHEGLRTAIASLDDVSLPAFAAMMAQEYLTRQEGFRFGQIVYVNGVTEDTVAMGVRDYVANYYRGRIIRAEDGRVYVAGKGTTLTVSKGAVLTVAEWKVRRAMLQKAKRIVDPHAFYTWERTDVAELSDPEFRPAWLDRKVADMRQGVLNSKAQRTHDYDTAPNAPRKRGRPRKHPAAVKPANTKAPINRTKAVRSFDVSAR